MAQMTKDVLEAHGFTVNYTFQAADKAIGTALVNGTIDMYWQYTGTELTDYLGLQTGSFPTALAAAFTFVQKADEPQRSLLGRTDTVRRHQRHRHQAESNGNLRQSSLGGVRHLPDVTSQHEGLHHVGVPHAARRSSRAS